MGDALALVMSRMRSFGPQDFVRFHPGGSLGRKLAKVDDVMRPLDQCRIALQDKTVRDVFVEVSRPGRRTGAIMLIDEQGTLAGLFTDSDLARLLEDRRDAYIDGPIGAVMTRSPKNVVSGSMMTDAVEVLVEKKISELPVIDTDGRPVGLIDVTDVVAWLPAGAAPAESGESSRPEDLASPQTVPFAGTRPEG
jgi:arabinose-5-phosphate isomerase